MESTISGGDGGLGIGRRPEHVLVCVGAMHALANSADAYLCSKLPMAPRSAMMRLAAGPGNSRSTICK
jgi:hypothetical protein